MYIFDLEGTLSDSKHREHYLPDYDLFHKFFPEDKVKIYNKILMDACVSTCRTVILTGMMEKHRAMAIGWLLKNGIKFDDLYMRRNDDLSPSPIFKYNFIRNCQQTVHMVFDDRADIVVKLLSHGIPAIVVK